MLTMCVFNGRGANKPVSPFYRPACVVIVGYPMDFALFQRVLVLYVDDCPLLSLSLGKWQGIKDIKSTFLQHPVLVQYTVDVAIVFQQIDCKAHTTISKPRVDYHCSSHAALLYWFRFYISYTSAKKRLVDRTLHSTTRL